MDTDEHIVKFLGRLPRSSLVKMAKSFIVSSGPAARGPTPVSIEGIAIAPLTRTIDPRKEQMWSFLNLNMFDAKNRTM